MAISDPTELLLYRDGLILILNKPAGIAVHRGPKGGESLEDCFGSLRFGLPRDPALAHRLDRDTSGCLILGRHRKALEQVGQLFKQGKVRKTYWAIVEGSLEAEQGFIDQPLGRIDRNRGWWMQPDPLGAPAQTRWRVLGRAEDALRGPLAWVEFEPLTGRTHQLRVHSSAAGWPIYADPIYGNGDRNGGETLHLLARSVSVPLHKNREPVTAVAPPPAHMLERLKACGWSPDDPQSVPDHSTQ